jgi:hypothetical protein
MRVDREIMVGQNSVHVYRLDCCVGSYPYMNTIPRKTVGYIRSQTAKACDSFSQHAFPIHFASYALILKFRDGQRDRADATQFELPPPGARYGGQGNRLFIPITAGTFWGPKLEGTYCQFIVLRNCSVFPVHRL